MSTAQEAVFTVYLDAAIPLTVKDIWPDGGAPSNPTAADVARVMESCGHKLRVLKEWSLIDRLAVSVDTEEVWTARTIPLEAQGGN